MRRFALTGAAALAITCTAFGASRPSDLENQVARLNAVHDIQNLMSRYAMDNFNDNFEDLMKYIAMDRPDVHINVISPQADGAKAIHAWYDKVVADRAAGKVNPGEMHLHPNSTPYIVVAGDLKTARGVFDSFAPGLGGGEGPGNWTYLRYGIDFINDKGTWKIWHLQLYPVLTVPSDRPLVQGAKERAASASPSQVMLPSGNGKTMPLWRYSGAGATPANYPQLPEPYETFDSKNSF